MNDKTKLKKYGLNYLSKYSTSKKNLIDILKRKILKITKEKKERFFLYNTIDEIIKEFDEKNFINDENYTNSKINFLIMQGKSKNYIFNYLIKKGIEKNLINQSLINLDHEKPDWQIDSAKIFIRKKRLIFSDEINKKKNIAKMIRAGFNYELIKKNFLN